MSALADRMPAERISPLLKEQREITARDRLELLCDPGSLHVIRSTDPIAAAKVAVAYAKSNEKLTIVGGSMGTDVLGPDGIKALATLPSLDELRAKLARMLQTPATRVATILQAPAGQLARVFGAYAKKGETA